MILADYSMLNSRKQDSCSGFSGSRREQLPAIGRDFICVAPAALRLENCIHH
jgi:hypothetical protein